MHITVHWNSLFCLLSSPCCWLAKWTLLLACNVLISTLNNPLDGAALVSRSNPVIIRNKLFYLLKKMSGCILFRSWLQECVHPTWLHFAKPKRNIFKESIFSLWTWTCQGVPACSFWVLCIGYWIFEDQCWSIIIYVLKANPVEMSCFSAWLQISKLLSTDRFQSFSIWASGKESHRQDVSAKLLWACLACSYKNYT